MTDQEIIQGLIERDNRVTEEFFYVKCRPLFYSIMKLVFSCEVDYDEMVNELYLYLMDGDASKLRNFQVAATAIHKSMHFFLLKWDVAEACPLL